MLILNGFEISLQPQIPDDDEIFVIGEDVYPSTSTTTKSTTTTTTKKTRREMPDPQALKQSVESLSWGMNRLKIMM